VQRGTNVFLKCGLLLGLLIGLFGSFSAHGQSARELLVKADSLHTAKKTEAAWDLYRSILLQKRAFSPRMLIRMALYAEAKGNLALALYYLNTCYQFLPNQEVKEKIKSLALQIGATGYTFGELDFAVFTFRRYYNELCLLSVGLTALILISIIINTIRRKPLVYRPVFFVAGLGLAIVVTNFNRLYRQAVVVKEPVTLRTGPSGASAAVSKINSGHRIFILDRQDIWLHTNWGGADAYIHSKNVELIEN
jgi:hypothetical protein